MSIQKNKKFIITIGIVVSVFILNIIISTTTGFNILSNTLNLITSKKSPNEIKSINITSDGYDTNKGGSYDVKKSAEWTGTDTAQVTFDVNTRMKTSDSNKDVIFVLDISGSMSGDKLNKVKSDAKELTESLLSNKDNRVSLITFDSTSTIEYELSNDKDEILFKIDSLTDKGNTNYNQALINVDKVLEGYEKQANRDLVVLFLTDGYPNEETPNQIAQYQMLKEKYPYMTINGVQYEMGTSIINDIKNISDNQYLANIETLNNVLFEASVTTAFYEKFEIVDYIDDEHFYVDSVDDIKVPIGKVTLTEEKGIQKITWTMSENEYRTGRHIKMFINLKLKEQYVGTEGYYSTNKGEEVTSKLIDNKEEKQTSKDTPILKTDYKVIYDTNTPTGCNIDDFEEKHYAFENVKISDKQLTCDGYIFKGWGIADEVKRINDDYFVMPSHDVTIKAIWAKQDINKSMDGTVYVTPPPIMKSYSKDATDDYHNSKYKNKVTKIEFKDSIDIPNSAIEEWDVSQEENSSVMAYIEDDGTGNGTYKVTICGKGEVIANEDSNNLFYDFIELKEITNLNNLNTSNVKSMSYMFYNCNKLTTLNVSNFDTSKVTDMSAIFGECKSLTALDVSNFDTSNVTTMGLMFFDCTNLTKLDLSNFNTNKVTTMLAMFYNCNMLTEVNISSFNTSQVRMMELMFYNCNSLTKLDVSNFDTKNVINMGSMFAGCKGLTTLNISNFNTRNVTDMNKMFMSCSGLTKLDVSNFDTSKVNNMSYMFYNCNKLTKLDVNNFNTSKVNNMSYMFYNCKNLTKLDVSNFHTNNVKNMGAMFRSCNSLTELNVSNLNTDMVTDMNNMFYNCNKLTTLDLSSFNTSKVTNMSNMFAGCNNLTTTIDIRTKTLSNYSNIFLYAAAYNGAKITVNYINDASSIVDNMINDKWSGSNIVKGSLITS